jgi:2-iminoacetate synthase ThiH
MNGSGAVWRGEVERAQRDSVTVEEGVRLLREAPLFDLGRAADAVRRRMHPDGVVT